VFAILFDMNELFEQFIFEVLKRNSLTLRISVRAQSKKRLVTAERDILNDGIWRAKNLFDTYTDIEVTSIDSGKKIILDTKYKLIGEGAHYGVGNSDVYQILAYKQIHSDGKVVPNVGLVYPQHRANLTKEFQVNGNGPTFFVTTLNLSNDLASNINELVRDVDSFLRAALPVQNEGGR
jgi:5-methylcytosine-specific restriction enzyme subunit McrC